MSDTFSTHHWPNRSRWMERVATFDTGSVPRAQAVRHVLAAARRHRVLVLNGSLAGYVDPVVAAICARSRRPPRIILTDCTW